jgi:hypothetical protein
MTLQTVISNSIADNSINISKLDVADGNAGEFLQTNGAGVLSFATAASTLTGGSGLVSMQVFESLGASNNAEQTWTKPAGVSRIQYYITGGGGTGSGGGGGTGGNGGGSGATAIGVFDVSGISSLQLRVGTGGAPGGSQSVTSLPTGFNSYIGDLVSGNDSPGQTSNQGTIATGGGGSGTSSGTALGGDFRLPGNGGSGGGSGIVGRGGASYWSPFGNGGSGGSTNSSTGNPSPGGRGTDGIVIIFEYA